MYYCTAAPSRVDDLLRATVLSDLSAKINGIIFRYASDITFSSWAIPLILPSTPTYDAHLFLPFLLASCIYFVYDSVRHFFGRVGIYNHIDLYSEPDNEVLKLLFDVDTTLVLMPS